MTLPHGFGSHDTPPTEKPNKCRLGKTCSSECGAGKCRVHYLLYRHSDAWISFQVIGGFILSVILFLFILGAVLNYIDHLEEPIRNIINGYDCKTLAEYVADKSKLYSYAEHRYEWLCVNEQVKEFQG